MSSRTAWLAGLLALGPSVHSDAVDDAIRAEMARQQIPGVSMAVMKFGKPIRMAGYGFADLEHRVRATPDTIYQSGSVGKQFTATLVMSLVEEGKIGLEDSIGKFFPEAAGTWDAVKLKNLLSHTSGLPDMPYGKMDLTRPYSEDELVKLMADQKPVEPPGTKWRYNNGGYVMLGVLVHRLTGTFYGDLLRPRVFDKAGMKTARIIDEAAIIPNRAAGYELTKSGLRNQEWVNPKLNTTADGSLYFTVRDLAAWDAALYGTAVISRASLAKMWTPFKLADGTAAKYGFGWGVDRVGKHLELSHGGAWQGFTTMIYRVPEIGCSVVFLANLDAGHVEFGPMLKAVLAMYAPELPKS